jgi:hypothetical protein
MRMATAVLASVVLTVTHLLQLEDHHPWCGMEFPSTTALGLDLRVPKGL